MGLFQIGRHPLVYSGKGLAWVGIALGVVGFVISTILIMSGALDFITRGLPRF